MLGSEMAIAAHLPAPRRLITDQGCQRGGIRPRR